MPAVSQHVDKARHDEQEQKKNRYSHRAHGLEHRDDRLVAERATDLAGLLFLESSRRRAGLRLQLRVALLTDDVILPSDRLFQRADLVSTVRADPQCNRHSSLPTFVSFHGLPEAIKSPTAQTPPTSGKPLLRRTARLRWRENFPGSHHVAGWGALSTRPRAARGAPRPVRRPSRSAPTSRDASAASAGLPLRWGSPPLLEDRERAAGQLKDCAVAGRRFVRPVAQHGALQRLPDETHAPVADLRELAAARIDGLESAHQAERDLRGAPRERRPREPDVDLRANKPRPRCADLGRDRGVRLGGACVVSRARPTRGGIRCSVRKLAPRRILQHQPPRREEPIPPAISRFRLDLGRLTPARRVRFARDGKRPK